MIVAPRRMLALAALVAALAGACTTDTPPTPQDPALAQGQVVYDANCASCHGRTGNGGLGPKLAGVMEERFPDIDDQVAVIAEGITGTNMPAFEGRLTPDEILAVARYEREVLGDDD